MFPRALDKGSVIRHTYIDISSNIVFYNMTVKATPALTLIKRIHRNRVNGAIQGRKAKGPLRMAKLPDERIAELPIGDSVSFLSKLL